MKRFIVLGAAIMVMAPDIAGAADLRQYASVKISDTVSGKADIEHYNHNTKTKEFFGIKAAYGMKLASFRTELELGLYEASKIKKISDAEVTHTTIMANAYYDVTTNSPFRPYIGAGIGYNRISLDTQGADDTDAALALKGTVGIAWEINQNFAIDVGYSYTDFGKYDQDSVSASFTGHELSMGLRYSL